MIWEQRNLMVGAEIKQACCQQNDQWVAMNCRGLAAQRNEDLAAEDGKNHVGYGHKSDPEAGFSQHRAGLLAWLNLLFQKLWLYPLLPPHQIHLST